MPPSYVIKETICVPFANVGEVPLGHFVPVGQVMVALDETTNIRDTEATVPVAGTLEVVNVRAADTVNC